MLAVYQQIVDSWMRSMTYQVIVRDRTAKDIIAV